MAFWICLDSWVSAVNQLSFCLCFNRCFFLNLHLSLWGFGVNTCLKLAVLRNSSDSACSLCWVHDPTLMEQCFLHDCPWSCWVLKDGAPGFFFNEGKRCKSSKCFVPGAEQLLWAVCDKSSQLLQGLEVGADAFLPPEAAASSSFTTSWHSRGAVSYNEFGSVRLLSSLETSATLCVLINLYK